jgi:hypothetical protein
MRLDVKERFLRHVEVVTESGCWIWTGALGIGGYGLFGGTHWRKTGVREKTRTAHRVSYELFKGPIPEDKIVLHSCDVRCCVNPAHLRVGTYQENMDDAVLRGRMAAGNRNGKHTHPEKRQLGEAHYKCKITEEVAFFIRYCGLSLPTVAKRYGISITQAHRIRTGNSWAQLPAFRGH